MSDDKKNMGDQQFSTYWDEISQLLTDLGYDVSKLISLKTDDYLSEKLKKRLDHSEGTVK